MRIQKSASQVPLLGISYLDNVYISDIHCCRPGRILFHVECAWMYIYKGKNIASELMLVSTVVFFASYIGRW